MIQFPDAAQIGSSPFRAERRLQTALVERADQEQRSVEEIQAELLALTTA